MGFVKFPGAVQVIENAWYGRDNGSYQYLDEWPILLFHTVEGRMERSAIGGHRSPPHLWVDPLDGFRDMFQTVGLDEPARALQNLPGGAPQTNRRGIMVQVELQLFSDPKKRTSPRHVSALSGDDLLWLADQVVAIDAIVADLDPEGRGVIPVDASLIPPMGPGDSGYGLGSRWRLTPSAFQSYRGGFLGHAHAPDNAHYDPSGDFPMRRLAELAYVLKVGAEFPEGNPSGALRRGLTHPAVRKWQALANLVFDVRLAEDSVFGPATYDATRQIEEWLIVAGLIDEADGVVDQELVDVVRRIRDDQSVGMEERPWRPAQLMDRDRLASLLSDALGHLSEAEAAVKEAADGVA